MPVLIAVMLVVPYYAIKLILGAMQRWPRTVLGIGFGLYFGGAIIGEIVGGHYGAAHGGWWALGGAFFLVCAFVEFWAALNLFGMMWRGFGIITALLEPRQVTNNLNVYVREEEDAPTTAGGRPD